MTPSQRVVRASRRASPSSTPAVEEAAKIKAALEALNGGPRPPVTGLDTLKPYRRPRG